MPRLAERHPSAPGARRARNVRCQRCEIAWRFVARMGRHSARIAESRAAERPSNGIDRIAVAQQVRHHRAVRPVMIFEDDVTEPPVLQRPDSAFENSLFFALDIQLQYGNRTAAQFVIEGLDLDWNAASIGAGAEAPEAGVVSGRISAVSAPRGGGERPARQGARRLACRGSGEGSGAVPDSARRQPRVRRRSRPARTCSRCWRRHR